jgi:hypothetical protein
MLFCSFFPTFGAKLIIIALRIGKVSAKKQWACYAAGKDCIAARLPETWPNAALAS